MACGCSGGGGGPLPQNNLAAGAGSGRSAVRVAVYQVSKDGKVVLSTTSPVAARQEAKRLGASVKVTSRPVAQEERQALAG